MKTTIIAALALVLAGCAAKPVKHVPVTASVNGHLEKVRVLLSENDGKAVLVTRWLQLTK